MFKWQNIKELIGYYLLQLLGMVKRYPFESVLYSLFLMVLVYIYLPILGKSEKFVNPGYGWFYFVMLAVLGFCLLILHHLLWRIVTAPIKLARLICRGVCNPFFLFAVYWLATTCSLYIFVLLKPPSDILAESEQIKMLFPLGVKYEDSSTSILWLGLLAESAIWASILLVIQKIGKYMFLDQEKSSNSYSYYFRDKLEE